MGPEGLLEGTRNRVVGMAPPPVDQAYNKALVAVVAVVASCCWIPIHSVQPIPFAIARMVLLGASPLLLDSSEGGLAPGATFVALLGFVLEQYCLYVRPSHDQKDLSILCSMSAPVYSNMYSLTRRGPQP